MKTILSTGRLTASLVLFFLVLLSALAGCRTKGEARLPDDRYAEWIAGYTGGWVSRNDNIRIRFNKPVQSDVADGARVAGKIVTFKPEIKGQLIKEDSRTLVFVPDRPLASGRRYTCRVNLAGQFPVQDPDLKTFSFGFRVVEQDFSVTLNDLTASGREPEKLVSVTGVVEMADAADSAVAEKMLTVSGGNFRSVTWEHDGNLHRFTVNDIERNEGEYELSIKVSGKPVDVDRRIDETVLIPARGEYRQVAWSEDNSRQALVVSFSMPLKADQDLKGLVEFKGDPDARFAIEKSTLVVFPSNGAGDGTLFISRNLQDSTGDRLKDDIEIAYAPPAPYPEVKLLHEGGILPTSDGAVFPFSAVSLKAVDVTVIRIFPDNIVQYFQYNTDVTGTSAIKLVGRPVAVVTVPLDTEPGRDLLEWNTYRLDLSRIVTMEPGAIYRVEIGFRISQNLHTPLTEEQLFDLDDPVYAENYDATASEESSYWDYYEGYYDEYGNYYGGDSWENRDNPGHPAYYGARRRVGANVLFSNLGLIGCRNDENKVWAWVTNLQTTEPLSGVTLTAVDYQGQTIATAQTDAQGKAVFDCSRQPFLLTASMGTETGYMKMDTSSALDYSSFDTGGVIAKRGIKGFIYTERGVYRPGDNIFTFFVLEDKDRILPAGHPVVLEFRDPQGTLRDRKVSREGVGNQYRFDLVTDSADPTGDWNVTVKVGQEQFSKTIKVESVKPNRMKVKVSVPGDLLTVSNPTPQVDLEVLWLHGAPAAKSKVETELWLAPAPTTFKSYPDYIFTDPTRNRFNEREQKVFTGTTDDQGRTSFKLNLNKKYKAAGFLTATLFSRAYEGSGDFSIDSYSMPFYPFTSYVGVKLPPGDAKRGMLLTDVDHKVDIVTLDYRGNPVSRSNLKVSLIQLDWHWWWDATEEDMSVYLEQQSGQVISTGTVNTTNGKGVWSFKVSYPSWGRYMLRVEDPASGHATGKIFYIDWPGWAGRSTGDGSVSRLNFFTDKEKYKVGDEVRLTIPASAKGRALISLENGRKVINSWFVETKEGETVTTFKVTREMTPNVYLHITMIQPHGQRVNDRPIRMYGIEPLVVEDPASRLEPVMRLPDTFMPESDTEITVSEKNGRPMTYSLMIVDEGLLDLTRYKTPNPHGSFFAREALGLRGWDIFRYVLGADAGKIGSLLAVGGSDAAPPAVRKEQRFEPMVIVLGPFPLKAGESKTHKLRIPRYIGSVRVMVVASDEGSYGATEKAVAVKSPLMVLGTLPRTLKSGEITSCAVNVFALNPGMGDVTLTIRTEGKIKVLGDITRKIKFTAPGDQYVFFSLESTGIGTGKVFVDAVAAGQKAAWSAPLEIHPPNPPDTRVTDFLIEPGKSRTMPVNTFGIPGTGSTRAEVSSLPPINMDKRLGYLIQYPYGCIEQTTSSVLPQLYLPEVVEMPEAQRKQIETNINAGIERLKLFQTADGGFAYWPGDRTSSNWGSCYAGQFLVEAKRRGYFVPESLYNSWKNYLTTSINNWRAGARDDDSAFMQAYRCYLLALAGEAPIGAMNRLRQEVQLPPQAWWMLAAAYAHAGKKDVARDIVKGLTVYTDLTVYDQHTYGEPIRDKALAVETLLLIGDQKRAYQIVMEVSTALKSEQWMSTQTTAACLSSLARYAINYKSTDGMKFNWSFGTQKGKSEGSGKSWITIPLGDGSGSFVLTNQSAVPLYVQVLTTAIPDTVDETPRSSGLQMTVVWKDRDGKVMDEPRSVNQGTDLVAVVTVRNTSGANQNELALETLFPSGWEILNLRALNLPQERMGAKPDYQDIRDDRIYTFFSLKQGESKQFVFYCNAAYAGRYRLPPFYCSAMYNAAVMARSSGYVTGVKPVQ